MFKFKVKFRTTKNEIKFKVYKVKADNRNQAIKLIIDRIKLDNSIYNIIDLIEIK